MKLPLLLLPLLAFFVGCSSSRSPIEVARAGAPIKVACVGDSITAGSGTNDRATESYPAQLARLLGPKWEVRNFGVSGATILNTGDRPYVRQPAYEEALAFAPDVVIVKLGTNDSKPHNWVHGANYEEDYAALIRSFAALPSRPRIFLCRPIPVFPPGGFRIDGAVVAQEIVPKVDAVARRHDLTVIDLHTALRDAEALVPDRVHPNAEGAALIARTVYRALTSKSATP